MPTAATYTYVFNRGAYKQDIFVTPDDYQRFQLLLYLHNTRSPVVFRDVLFRYKHRSVNRIFEEEFTDKSLVDILAYSLMPSHFHLLLKEKVSNGIPTFMHKLCTAYSMYFNASHDHSGVLFEGNYRSQRMNDDSYFRYIYAYMCLDPIGLTEINWKNAREKNTDKYRMTVSSYPYASYFDYHTGHRPESAILSMEKLPRPLLESTFSNLVAWRSRGPA
jgi:putative transposase